jgi:kumamolisin
MGAPIQLVLKLRERVSMSTLAASVEDPTSPRYRKFYTPEEIRQIAAPTDASYQALLKGLSDAGITVVQESPSHLILTVSADSDVIQNLFGIKFITKADARRTFSGLLSIPQSLKLIASVSGLDTQRHMVPLHKHMLPNIEGISVMTVRQLYGFDALYQQGLSGAGQHLAIATYDDVDLSDEAEFFQMNSISPAPVVDKIPVNGTPQTNSNSAMETDTDIELSGAMAPGIHTHVFCSATNDDPGELALFTSILDDNRAKVVNYSYGGCEKDLTAQHKSDMNSVFERAVAQGVNIMVASGDSGSACPEADAQGNVTSYVDPGADWPAAHPDVVAVGGTSLNTSSTTLSETAWTGSGQAGGSGGGISLMWNLPGWQQMLGGQFTMRSYPDVAFNADPNSGETVVINMDGLTIPMGIGGTSIAAPQWSGFMLLVGEARTKANLSGLGFLNPILYAMSASNKATALNDITSGNNGKYTAGKGWDAVTGWGSLNAQTLLTVLTSN